MADWITRTRWPRWRRSSWRANGVSSRPPCNCVALADLCRLGSGPSARSSWPDWRRTGPTFALMETALTALGPIEMEAKRLITWSHECLRENWAGAAETISEVLESPVESPLGPIVVCVLTLDLAATLIADGRWSEGASALDRAEAQADGFREPAPLVRARVMLFRARVFLSSGSVAQADHAAYDSLGLAVDCEFGLARIDALEVIATISRQRGNDRLAARLLGACAAEREAIGYANRMSSGVDTTVPDAHRSSFEQGRALGIVEATALARRSRGARRRPAFGFESLTPTERTVAELVVLGRTNDEIAAELLIASTTVKTHLTRIFAKLGLQNSDPTRGAHDGDGPGRKPAPSAFVAVDRPVRQTRSARRSPATPSVVPASRVWSGRQPVRRASGGPQTSGPFWHDRGGQ